MLSEKEVFYDVYIWVSHPEHFDWMNGWRHISSYQDKQTAIDVMNLLPIKNKRLKRVVERVCQERVV